MITISINNGSDSWNCTNSSQAFDALREIRDICPRRKSIDFECDGNPYLRVDFDTPKDLTDEYLYALALRCHAVDVFSSRPFEVKQ